MEFPIKNFQTEQDYDISRRVAGHEQQRRIDSFVQNIYEASNVGLHSVAIHQ